eukprot:6853767-Alexandrium_andersonii.AAC.1
MSLAGSTTSAAAAGSLAPALRGPSRRWAAGGSGCVGASGGSWPGATASIVRLNHWAQVRSEHTTEP